MTASHLSDAHTSVASKGYVGCLRLDWCVDGYEHFTLRGQNEKQPGASLG